MVGHYFVHVYSYIHDGGYTANSEFLSLTPPSGYPQNSRSPFLTQAHCDWNMTGAGAAWRLRLVTVGVGTHTHTHKRSCRAGV